MSSVILVGGLDVAELAFYLFFLFFIGLVWYLNRESRREGYPLEHDISGVVGNDVARLDFSDRKTFQLPHGLGTYTPEAVPRDALPTNVLPRVYPGTPLDVIGEPLGSGVGPGGYALRADRPDIDMFGRPRIVPMAIAEHVSVATKDVDPRGLPVSGLDGLVAGTVRDIWVDRAEHVIRYIDVALTDGGTATLPMAMARISRRGVVSDAIKASQFAGCPQLKSPTQITLLEEEKVSAYFGAGYLWATPERSEPLL
ncbi:photosynthetic reaction center subunit H [Polymorphobacter fuscus]|uniref:Photosynthetic reaction center subunit H n=1 Tax=Sandarakinorhabdus fusca TaxID=1439888 RepID=A0A7C9GR17_9SPHN|nr:photosynthetic reaction center subunit H [Polymorphobacter fuscus]KAB7644857.1 photosynthetic reaction center subunit H [Polymorphobacter fuscus]MQT18136.1 photosynthetic reaction center subunit H [Polymorphobacter fuscus]NJC09454.1 photosynthetic reaction center H subunit [Polymorphobacter fuscus]